jgi:hypothetical protein
MKQYLLSIYQPQGGTPPPAALKKIMRDVDAMIEEAKGADAWVLNGGLEPPGAARVVRVRGADALVTDGPYIETKEHLGGFVVVKAPDLDAALGWARKLARAVSPLAIEVRAFR